MEKPSYDKKTTIDTGEGKQPLPDRSCTSEQTDLKPGQSFEGDHDQGDPAGDETEKAFQAQDSYSKRQAEKDHQYKKDYKNWTDKMSSSKLQKLKELGVAEPEVGYSAKGGPKQDLADSSAASYEPDIAALIDGEAEESDVRDVIEALRHLVAELLSHANARLTLECLALVFGLRPYDGESMTAIAKRHGITPAAVSKRCVAVTTEFRIPPSRAMRSFQARESARKAQLKRNRREKP